VYILTIGSIPIIKITNTPIFKYSINDKPINIDAALIKHKITRSKKLIDTKNLINVSDILYFELKQNKIKSIEEMYTKKGIIISEIEFVIKTQLPENNIKREYQKLLLKKIVIK